MWDVETLGRMSQFQFIEQFKEPGQEYWERNFDSALRKMYQQQHQVQPPYYPSVARGFFQQQYQPQQPWQPVSSLMDVNMHL